MPVLIVWGTRDRIIPVEHGKSAHEAMPGSRLEIFEEAGHLPQVEAPARFVASVDRFMTETEPSRFDPEQWRSRIRAASD
jgi:pimeloyl-ACP methyl ester carboxylesterase